MENLLSRIKDEVKRAGTNKKKFVYVRDGEKRRFRFITDMNDGFEIKFHDSFSGGVVPTPCQEIFGRSCPYCENEGDYENLRTRNQYAWTVWDYEDNELKVFMYPVNNCSPVPHLISYFENYGTLCDRDYVVSVSGKQQNKAFSVIPMDKVAFRNAKAKPFSKKQMLKMLDEAFPCDANKTNDSDDDFPMPKPGTTLKNIDEWGENEKLPSEEELKSMSPQKLYNLCKERDIDAKPRQKADYYIDMLEDWRADNETEEESDYDAGQDWGDEEEEKKDKPDYSGMTAKELYSLCKERGINVQPRKPEKYYINNLEEYDKAHDDWEDDGDTDEWEEE